jgi:glycyl-tRNA synthetase beta chain
MPDYLLEVGTEELPADQVPEAQERLKTLLGEALKEANVKFDEMSTMGTPRRLTCIVHGIAEVQDTVQKKVAGPAVKSAFDPSGKPTPAAAGFAQKHGLTVDQLAREDVGGVEKLVANLTVQGKPVGEVLAEIVPQAIVQLSGERLMRWGACDLRFSRPIRWIVSLLGDQEIAITLDTIKSGRQTFGNRVLAPGAVQIQNPAAYTSSLKKACVLADPGERQQTIRQQVEKIAAAVKGKPRQLNGPLLEEVVNITEWPHAVLGEFEHEYLDLPDKLIETIMVHHQRYFPIERAEGGDGKQRLLPYFVTIANNDRKEAEPIIKQGNERVIRARLADGRFFYFDDQKTRLKERDQALKQLTFQEGLGTYFEKVQRLMSAARILIDSLHLEPRVMMCLERTMELCKLDLVTNLVRELPELQGYVGSWYAEREGEPPDVVNAIASHYAPRSQSDSIPPDTVGQFAALIDKLDNLVGLFALGRKPSGSSDPYALRRQAQGVVDILIDGLNEYRVNASALIELLLGEMEPLLAKRKNFDHNKVVAEVRNFILQRVRVKLLDKGYRREVIDAVLGTFDPLDNLPDVVVRCQLLKEILSREDGVAIVRAGVRMGNILKPESPSSVDTALFACDAETVLWNAFQQSVVAAWEKDGQFEQPRTLDQYRRMIGLLNALVVPVDGFFDNVMVNDPDATKKNNRHAILKNIYQYYAAVADFPKLQPLLP